MFLIFLDDGRYQEGSLEAHLEKEKRQMMTTDHWDFASNICDAVQKAKGGAEGAKVQAVIYDDKIGRIIDRVKPPAPDWMDDIEHVKYEGIKCPKCWQTDDMSVSIAKNEDGPHITQRVRCRNCNAEWTDTYRLDGYIID